MDAEVVKKAVKPKRKRLPKLFIIAGAVIVIGALAAVFIFKGNVFSKKNTVAQRTATVTKGSLSVTVTGSGAVESSDRADVTPTVTGKLTKVCFKEGDKVKKGDLMFEIDDSDAKLNADKIKTSISQAELTAGSNTKNLKNLVIKAPFSGRVTNITAKAGDEFDKAASIMTITDTSELKVTVPFSSSVIGKISQGQTVSVNIQDIMQTVQGKVTYKSNNSYISDNGGEVCDVEITIKNPGSLKEGMVASAESVVNGKAINGTSTGKLAYADTQTIKSSSGGYCEIYQCKRKSNS